MEPLKNGIDGSVGKSIHYIIIIAHNLNSDRRMHVESGMCLYQSVTLVWWGWRQEDRWYLLGTSSRFSKTLSQRNRQTAIEKNIRHPSLAKHTCTHRCTQTHTCTNIHTHKKGKIKGKMVNGIAQQVKVLVTKPGDLSSILQSHIVEGENQFPQAVL